MIPHQTDVTFRCSRGEVDYPLLLAIMNRSLEADGIARRESLAEMTRRLAPSDRFDPSQDVLISAVDQGNGQGKVAIGFSRMHWYTGQEDTRLYCQSSYLLPEWRYGNLWRTMVERNERRLNEIAASHVTTTSGFLQGWATDTQQEWMSVLENAGYKNVRRYHNMIHELDEIPERSLRQGIEIRPVSPSHFRKIWEVQREINHELFEFVAEDWTEESYNIWREKATYSYHIWQVAWDGDSVVGMVLNRMDDTSPSVPAKRRGHTEQILVRRQWRKRGVASALIAESLRILRAQGMEEVELGVDSENASNALELYRRLGYSMCSIDTWFRKPMLKEG